VVGRHKQQFIVHKDSICGKSKFFEAACSKLWREGKKKLVRLPEVKAGTFQTYVIWLYSGEIPVNRSSSDNVAKMACDEYDETVELYLLGDVLDDLLLRNAAMRALVAGKGEVRVYPGSKIATRIWDSTPPGSRLQRMVVDMTIKCMSREHTKNLDGYPDDMLRSIAIAFLERVPTVSDEAFVSKLDDYLEPEPRNDSEIAEQSVKSPTAAYWDDGSEPWNGLPETWGDDSGWGDGSGWKSGWESEWGS
jgi:hypothetical protein